MYSEATVNNFQNVTPYWRMPEGMYLLKRSSSYPFVEHYGVLITAGLAGNIGHNSYEAIVIQQTWPQARIDAAEDTGSWGVVEKVSDYEISAALERVTIAFQDPNYYLFANNCEQFARFIVSGRKTSRQLGTFALTGLIVAAVVLGRSDN
jgi:hypothetical protein